MQQTLVVTINPPLWIIDIGNGCEAFSSMIYIPAKSELTATMQSLTKSQFFLNYNFKYRKISTFVVFQNRTMAKLTPKEKEQLKSRVKTHEPMNMDLLNQELQLIEENYPLSMPPWAILGFQLVSGGFILTKLSMMTCLCVKHRESIPVLLKFGFSLACKFHQNLSIIKHLIQQADEFFIRIHHWIHHLDQSQNHLVRNHYLLFHPQWTRLQPMTLSPYQLYLGLLLQCHIRRLWTLLRTQPKSYMQEVN